MAPKFPVLALEFLEICPSTQPQYQYCIMWPNLRTAVPLFFGICVFRILNTFLIQSFFDPDEYWQTLEPAYCEVFLKRTQQSNELNLECDGYTWEWRRRAAASNASNATTKTMSTAILSWIQPSLEGPIRSYLSVVPTHLFYTMLAKFHWDSHFWVSQGPKLLMAVIAAAPTDLAVWIMAHWMAVDCSSNDRKQQQTSTKPQPTNDNLPWFCLFCSMASWFHGYTLVRTYSNSFETMLLTISMALVSPVSTCSTSTTLMPCFVMQAHSS